MGLLGGAMGGQGLHTAGWSATDSGAAERCPAQVDTLVYDSGLEAGDAARLAAALAHASLGKAQAGVLTWLLEAMDPTKQLAPTTRAKAVKALGDVVAADTRVLAAPAVQAAVEGALQDEAVSVREAAVALLGRHIGNDRDLALRLFNTLARASTDAGTSVRRSAIKILWECCMRQPGFSRATDACKHVLMRAGDPEESIQNEARGGCTPAGNSLTARILQPFSPPSPKTLIVHTLFPPRAGGQGLPRPLVCTPPGNGRPSRHGAAAQCVGAGAAAGGGGGRSVRSGRPLHPLAPGPRPSAGVCVARCTGLERQG